MTVAPQTIATSNYWLIETTPTSSDIETLNTINNLGFKVILCHGNIYGYSSRNIDNLQVEYMRFTPINKEVADRKQVSHCLDILEYIRMLVIPQSREAPYVENVYSLDDFDQLVTSPKNDGVVFSATQNIVKFDEEEEELVLYPKKKTKFCILF